MMLLTLDNLAYRYGMLPSEALARADTLDIQVLDISAKWAKEQNERADGKKPGFKKPSVAEMLDMIKRARGE